MHDFLIDSPGPTKSSYSIREVALEKRIIELAAENERLKAMLQKAKDGNR